MNFAEALEQLKAGKTVTRAEWDGKFEVSLLHGRDLAMKDNNAGYVSHNWMAGSAEMLADDWTIVAPAEQADFDKEHPAA